MVRNSPALPLATVIVCAVAAAAARASECEYLRFDRLSVEQGLSHGTVHAIAQDQQGFMWFGTEDGLNRYDGSSVEVYRHRLNDPDSLSSSNFGKIIQDRSGVLWLGTWGGGLDRYDPATGRFRHFAHDPDDPGSISSNRIEFLHEGRDGLLWIGTERDGLNRFDPATGKFTRYFHDPARDDSLPDDRVLAIWEDPSGILWIGTDAGLARLDPTTGAVERWAGQGVGAGRLADARIRALAGDDRGSLWIGTRGGGLERLDLATGNLTNYHHAPDRPGSLSGNSVARLYVDSNGTLWVATYASGLNCYDAASDRFERVNDAQSDPAALSGSRVESFREDRSRNLWIGTRGGGANKLDLKPRKFLNYIHDPDDAAGLPHPGVRAIAPGPGGAERALWIGTDGGGLALLDRATRTFTTLRHDPHDPASISDDRVLSLLAGRDGALWVGTYTGGLNRIVTTPDGYRFARYRHDSTVPGSLSNDRIQSIHEDSRGELWVGTADGLNRALEDSDGTLSFQLFRHVPDDPASLSDSYVIDIEEDRSGTLWIGTQNGLNRLEPDRRRFIRYQHRNDDPNSISSDIVHAIREDRKVAGRLWVGTEDGGLNRFDTGKGVFRAYMAPQGLPSNLVASLEQQEDGRIWLSGSRGLSRFDPTTGVFRNYDLSDGLLTHSFVRNASWRSDQEEFFFGSIAGLSLFDADEVQDNPHVPPVAITSFKRFNEEVEFDRPLTAIDGLTLDYQDNFFSFEFSVLDFTAPRNNQYAYMLQGVDADWVQAGNRNFANYTGVPPGDYVFRVTGSNNDGLWNEEGVSIALRITPPFWQTLWFRLGVVAASLLMITSAYLWRTRSIRFRTRRLLEVNSRLNREMAERRRAEAERERFVHELEDKNAELERFTYTVSHDLKTPLVTIEGFLDLLEIDVANGNGSGIAEDLSHLHQATGNMQRLLDDLLDLSRAGSVVPPGQVIALDSVVQEAVLVLRGRLDAIGAEVEFAAGLPDVVADRVRLVEVFQNLIENATKFMGDQPCPAIRISAERRGDEVVCRVEDNGIGIDSKHHSTVFGLFERLDTRGEGTGIGLALVKRIVEVYGGWIRVESDGPGCGCTFVFALPAAN